MTNLADNLKNNPTVADIFASLVAVADECGLGHDGASRYSSQGGSRYLHIGRKINEDGDWNDQLTIRVANHGANGSRGPRDLHLTTVQDPAELQANIELTISRIRAL